MPKLYTPDNWTLYEITDHKTGEVVRKVLAGWYGGFAGSDSWKLNSGNTKEEDCGEYWLFTGYTGSTYKCFKQCQRETMLMMSISSQLMSLTKEQNGATAKRIKL